MQGRAGGTGHWAYTDARLAARAECFLQTFKIYSEKKITHTSYPSRKEYTAVSIRRTSRKSAAEHTRQCERNKSVPAPYQRPRLLKASRTSTNNPARAPARPIRVAKRTET